jgi:uncharacterized protein YxjI
MEKLNNHNLISVNQKVELLEAFTGFETKNKYQILTEKGEQLYFAAEESSFLGRLFLKKMRPFQVHILDISGKAILSLKCPFRFFFRETSIVSKIDGQILGNVKRRFSLFSKKFEVQNSSGQIIYIIEAPFLHPWTFKILENYQEKGCISKKWSGLSKEMFTDADNFGIKFPDNISIKEKSILLGALFLIDIIYFEK